MDCVRISCCRAQQTDNRRLLQIARAVTVRTAVTASVLEGKGWAVPGADLHSEHPRDQPPAHGSAAGARALRSHVPAEDSTESGPRLMSFSSTDRSAPMKAAPTRYG